MNKDNNLIELHELDNPLNQLLKQGAQQLLAQAIEAEIQSLLAQFATDKIDGKQRVVRNGYLPERTVQTGVLVTSLLKCPRFVIERGMELNSTAILFRHTLNAPRILKNSFPGFTFAGSQQATCNQL